jgi:hypothetical protein
MTNTQEVKQTLEIKAFKERILKVYGANIFIYTKDNTMFNINLKTIGECTLKAVKEHHPEFNHIKSLYVRKRPRPFLVYVQALSYIAYKDGHSKTSIGLYLKRSHATVINSIKMVENALFTNDKLILKAIDNILKEIEHVGTIPKNLKSKPESKPSVDTIWDEARRFIASNLTE